MSHVFFLPNFVTEKSGNRDVPLFGSVQNAKVPAPTPSLSLMSRFFPNFVTEKSENRDVTLFGSIQNAKVPAPTPRLSLMSRFFFRILSPKKLKIAMSHFSGTPS